MLLYAMQGDTRKLHKELLATGQGRRDVVSNLIAKVSTVHPQTSNCWPKFADWLTMA